MPSLAPQTALSDSAPDVSVGAEIKFYLHFHEFFCRCKQILRHVYDEQVDLLYYLTNKKYY